MKSLRIAVVGAGIAGLTAAIAFARHGAEVAILEQAEDLSAVGAGLQLSPNATAVLDRLGLMPAIESRWCEIDRVALRSGKSLATIAGVPMGAFARRRWRAPYGVIHRAELQDILVTAVRKLPACRLMLGTRLDARSLAEAKAAIGSSLDAPPDLIVGADGVWSPLRKLLPGTAPAKFSGYAAWRMIVPAHRLESIRLEDDGTTAFLGPRSHLVVYPVAGRHSFNVVAVARSPAPTLRPSASESSLQLDAAFAGWHPAIRSAVTSAGDAILWPLHEVADGPWRAENDLILIGDAAHAMMPFAAQGAAMAIEDAFDLADTYVNLGPAGLSSFEHRRRARVEKVRQRTALNRFAYHARGPLRLGRDMVLATRKAESLAADFDWLYGYRMPGLDT